MTEPAAPTERTEPTLDSSTRADQSDELATTTMLRGAIGPVNTDYYLRIFTRFDTQDRAGASWNTAAALTTLNWMLFRKLWNAALAYTGIALGLALLVFGIGKLAFHYPPEVQWTLAGLYALLLVLVPGFWGNALLFRQARSDMAGALSANQSIADAAALLLSRAPTRKRLIVLAALNVVAGGLLLALVLWARDFQGMPQGLTASESNPPATAPLAAASGNVAVGRATEVASAPAPTASLPAQPASAPASAPQGAAAASAVAVAASAPGTATSAPAAAAKASAPAAGASAPASAPVPAKPASAPPAKAPATATPASAPAAPKTVEPARRADAKPEPAPAAKPKAAPAQAPAKTPPPPKSSAEKAEAAKLAPQAAAQQQARKAAAPSGSKTTLATTAPGAGDQPGVPAGQFGINVGLFADPNNARNAFVKLSDAGLPAYTQAVQGKKGAFTRVRVGPFDSLAEAERSAARIRTLGLDALVFQQGAPR